MATKISVRAEKILRETQAPYLVSEERKLLARFITRLESECGDSIHRMILFGSKARGDADEESDTDVLIVVADNAQEKVKEIVEEYRDETSLWLNAWVFNDEDYQNEQRVLSPFYVNLRREAIELWDERAKILEEKQLPLDFPEGEFREMDEQTHQVIRHYIEEANHNWIAVEGLRDAAPDIAAARAYFSAFYWLTAALYAVNIVRRHHHDLAAAMSEFLVKPKYIQEEYKDIYLKLMNVREVVDYYAVIVSQKKKKVQRPTKVQAHALIADTQRFIARMEQFLRERGAID